MSDEMVLGLDELVRKLNALTSGRGEIVRAGLLAGGHTFEGFVKASMTGSKSGRKYRRGIGGVHTASAPGEAPAIDYSHLITSIGVQAVGDEEVMVFTSAEYGPALEFGTAHMQPRPFFRPPVDERRAEVTQAVAFTVERLIREKAQ